MKLDLGCGTNKQQGYTGIDRVLLPGVDIVFDMDDGLPFADDSVDSVMASHSLEHVRDLMAVMEEIYRVCRHKAVVCVLAPYAATSLNIGNPFHRWHFNEHTPRFFTSCGETRVPVEEFAFPYITQWGLGGAENPGQTMDFRCVRMEFFYFEQYRGLGLADKRALRKNGFNVVDQIMYHLVAVKQPVAIEELDAIAGGPLDVPAFVAYRRSVENPGNL